MTGPLEFYMSRNISSFDLVSETPFGFCSTSLAVEKTESQTPVNFAAAPPLSRSIEFQAEQQLVPEVHGFSKTVSAL